MFNEWVTPVSRVVLGSRSTPRVVPVVQYTAGLAAHSSLLWALRPCVVRALINVTSDRQQFHCDHLTVNKLGWGRGGGAEGVRVVSMSERCCVVTPRLTLRFALFLCSCCLPSTWSCHTLRRLFSTNCILSSCIPDTLNKRVSHCSGCVRRVIGFVQGCTHE